MANLARTTILLDSKEYHLAREEIIEQLGVTARRWQEELLPIATQIEDRPDVAASDIPGEYIITWNDWSKGLCGERENIPGCYLVAQNVNTTRPGSLHPLDILDNYSDNTQTQGGNPATWIEFDGILYLIAGRYCYKFFTTTMLMDEDFGAGHVATDAIVHNNALVVCFGGSTNKIKKMDTAGSWTTASDAVYANYFALVEDRLWRATATNEISDIGPTDDPFTLTNWSAGITIGDDDIPITDLNDLGQRVVVSKEDGLFLGDEAVVFPNVLPQLKSTPNADNGKGTLVRGEDIFFPHTGGLLRYTNGRVEEIGIHLVAPNPSLNTTQPNPLGYKISALAAQGHYIWAAVKPALYRRADPYFKKTTDTGSSYTDYSTVLGDNIEGTNASIASLDTLANGDWVIVGYDGVFNGIAIHLEDPNDNTSTLSTHYWNGSAWTAFGTNEPVIDGTAVSGVTLARSDAITWQKQPGTWATSTIDGQLAYWVRLTVSATLGSSTRLKEVRIIRDAPYTYLLRGRPRRPNDIRSQSIIWDSVFFGGNKCESPYITALMVSGHWYFHPYPSLVGASQQHVIEVPLTLNTIDGPIATFEAGHVYLSYHDGGMPNTNKEFLSFTTNGKKISANHVVGIYYQLETASSLKTASASITTSPTVTTLSADNEGYAIAPRITFSAVAHDEMTEVNSLECRFRVLPTYKSHYQVILELSGKISQRVQKTNLSALVGSSSITLKDPLGDSHTVNVTALKFTEVAQAGLNYPLLLAQLEMVEI